MRSILRPASDPTHRADGAGRVLPLTPRSGVNRWTLSPDAIAARHATAEHRDRMAALVDETRRLDRWTSPWGDGRSGPAHGRPITHRSLATSSTIAPWRYPIVATVRTVEQHAAAIATRRIIGGWFATADDHDDVVTWRAVVAPSDALEMALREAGTGGRVYPRSDPWADADLLPSLRLPLPWVADPRRAQRPSGQAVQMDDGTVHRIVAHLDRWADRKGGWGRTLAVDVDPFIRATTPSPTRAPKVQREASRNGVVTVTTPGAEWLTVVPGTYPLGAWRLIAMMHAMSGHLPPAMPLLRSTAVVNAGSNRDMRHAGRVPKGTGRGGRREASTTAGIDRRAVETLSTLAKDAEEATRELALAARHRAFLSAERSRPTNPRKVARWRREVLVPAMDAAERAALAR